MTKDLDQRLLDIKSSLDNIHAAGGGHGGLITPVVAEVFRGLADHRNDVAYWRTALTARDASFRFLSELEKSADGDDLVDYGTTRTSFRIARLLGVQAYLTTYWSLADRIT